MSRFYSGDSTDSSSSDSPSPWNSSPSSSSSSSDSSDSSDEDTPPVCKRIKKSEIHEKDSKDLNVQSELNFDHVIKAHYKWVINNYNKKCLLLKLGDKLESSPFVIGSNNELKFKLLLYPKGANDHNKNYVSVFLVLLDSKESKIKLSIKYNVINKKNREIVDDHCVDINSGIVLNQRFGFKKLFKNDSDSKKCDYIDNDNDKLIITCDITVTLNKTNRNKIKVVEDLGALLDSGNYSDVTLKVQNKKFKAHMYILAARSSVFAAMFSHDMKEKNEKVVNITDISSETMKQLLQFTYTGEVKNIDESAKDLLAAADKYDFEDLKSLCENALIKSMTSDNAVDLLNFAELYTSDKLKDYALKYIVNHVQDVINTPSFKTMGNKSPLLAQIICRMAAQKT